MRLLAAAGVLFTCVVVVRAQNPEPRIWQGVYSTAQAERGKTSFNSSCLRCHGDKLQGNTAPALSGDRFFINNDRGELIIAKLSPDGYQEISRTPLVKPTTRVGNRRELGVVNWSHPAYANRQILARNDEEILSASLERE